MRSSIFTIIIVLSSFLCSYSQEVDVRGILDSTFILIGGQANLTLEADVALGSSVGFPVLLDTLTRAIEIIDVQSVDSTLLGGEFIRYTKNFTITSFDSGYHVIPPLPITIQTPSGARDTLFTKLLGLNTWLVPVDTSLAIKPIKGLENIPYSWRDALPWLLIGLLVLVVLAGGYFYWRNRALSKDTEVSPIKPKEPPYILAMRELDQLSEEKLWQSGKVKAHHAKLSQIVRRYIEGRYRIPALEQTNDEILAAFRNSGLERDIPFEDLKQLLYLADIVKFAKGKPQPTDNQRSIEQAYDFVRKTKAQASETLSEKD